jgi:hypothetical protein
MLAPSKDNALAHMLDIQMLPGLLFCHALLPADDAQQMTHSVLTRAKSRKQEATRHFAARKT